MKNIVPCLWFDTEGEAAAELYTSVFPNSKILDIAHYGEAGPRPAGTVMTVSFELNGQEFLALNGGPEFTFSEAVSFMERLTSKLEKYGLGDLIEPGEPNGGEPTYRMRQ